MVKQALRPNALFEAEGHFHCASRGKTGCDFQHPREEALPLESKLVLSLRSFRHKRGVSAGVSAEHPTSLNGKSLTVVSVPSGRNAIRPG